MALLQFIGEWTDGIADWYLPLMSVFLGAFVIARVLRPYLKARAKRVMTGMLRDAGIISGKDIIIKDDDIFLQWMRNGTLGIGETYMDGQWEARVPLEDIFVKLVCT